MTKGFFGWRCCDDSARTACRSRRDACRSVCILSSTQRAVAFLRLHVVVRVSVSRTSARGVKSLRNGLESHCGGQCGTPQMCAFVKLRPRSSSSETSSTAAICLEHRRQACFSWLAQPGLNHSHTSPSKKICSDAIGSSLPVGFASQATTRLHIN